MAQCPPLRTLLNVSIFTTSDRVACLETTNSPDALIDFLGPCDYQSSFGVQDSRKTCRSRKV